MYLLVLVESLGDIRKELLESGTLYFAIARQDSTATERQFRTVCLPLI